MLGSGWLYELQKSRPSTTTTSGGPATTPGVAELAGAFAAAPPLGWDCGVSVITVPLK